MAIDPLASMIISAAFAILFLTTAWQKLGDFVRFQGILEDYQLLPQSAVKATAVVLIGLEMLTAGLWVLAPTAAASLLSALLIAGYAVAVAVNLRRGRTYISCGCGLSGSADESISGALLWRNGVLLLVISACWLPVTDRMIVAFDYVIAVCGLAIAWLLYVTANQLLANHAEMKAWRVSND